MPKVFFWFPFNNFCSDIQFQSSSSDYRTLRPLSTFKKSITEGDLKKVANTEKLNIFSYIDYLFCEKFP